MKIKYWMDRMRGRTRNIQEGWREGVPDFSQKPGGRKDMKQLNRCAFELLILVPSYLSTGLGQGVGWLSQKFSV